MTPVGYIERRAKKTKKKGKKKGTTKTALQQKKGKLNKKKRALEGQIFFDKKSGLATGIKAEKIKKFDRKRGKNSPSGKKGLPKKKKRRGEEGHIEKSALQKKGHTKRKKLKGWALFFEPKKISPSSDIA